MQPDKQTIQYAAHAHHAAVIWLWLLLLRYNQMLDAHACMHGHILALIKLPLRTAMLASCILAVVLYVHAYYFMGLNKQRRILTHACRAALQLHPPTCS